jgi:sporulation protein YlmC with PRC-barrel domain
MLMKLLEEYKVTNTVGEPVGRIKEAYLDLDNWEIVAFKVHPGALKKSIIIDLADMVRLNLEDQILVIKDDFETKETPKVPVKGFYPFEKLIDLRVVDADGEKVGRIYNLEIPYEKMQRFKIWKILIRTSIKEKRLRLSPSEIKDVKQEVHLKKKEKEYVEQKE